MTRLYKQFGRGRIAVICLSVTLATPAAAGTSYGIYDARTLAMGGASVASANNDNAQFYNSALLAFNDEIEEKTQDGRFLFPILVPQVSESAITLEDLAQDDPRQNITRAINAFNAAPDAVNARAVLAQTENLNAALADVDGEDLSSDIYFGMAVSEPGKFHGAGFFFGTRLVAGGLTTVTESDRAILDDYREALTFVSSGGSQGEEHPELFDANGGLIDPGNTFDSSVSAAGVLITEAGVAMSRQLNIFGQAFAAGFSFKVQRIDAFEDVETVADDRVDVDRNRQYNRGVNFDIGLVKELGEHWRIGVAVKDILPNNYDTALGTPIRLRPRARLGAAYQTDKLQVAVDVDVSSNEPLGNESRTQEAALGIEWHLQTPLKLRAGYRYDFQGNRDGVASLGIGTIWKRLAIDVAYAAGSDARALALQLGYVF